MTRTEAFVSAYLGEARQRMAVGWQPTGSDVIARWGSIKAVLVATLADEAEGGEGLAQT